MTKKKRAKSYARTITSELELESLPFIGLLQENPLGGLVAIFLFLLTISYFASGLATNPFNGYSDWTSLWSLLGNQFQWLLLAAFPFFLIGVVFEGLKGGGEAGPGGFQGPASKARQRIAEARAKISAARGKPAVASSPAGSSNPENIN